MKIADVNTMAVDTCLGHGAAWLISGVDQTGDRPA